MSTLFPVEPWVNPYLKPVFPLSIRNGRLYLFDTDPAVFLDIATDSQIVKI